MDLMTESEVLASLQQSQKPWIVHSFPGHKPWHPLLGIVEEFGELAAAKTESDREDAVGDVMIYAADYCSEMGWHLADLWEESKVACLPEQERVEASILVNLGRLCHAHLKQAQGIRNGENWDAEGRRALSKLLVCLRHFSSEMDVVAAADKIWGEVVSKRDWRSNSAFG